MKNKKFGRSPHTRVGCSALPLTLHSYARCTRSGTPAAALHSLTQCNRFLRHCERSETISSKDRDDNKKNISLTFIRHGKTSGNLEKRYIGKTDEPLCENGESEIKKNILEKKYPPADIIISSPMKRCLETCSLIYPNRPPIIIEEFKEMDFGDFEGKNYDELKSNPEYQKWLESKGKIPFPNGESREDFITRTNEGFQKMLQKIVHLDNNFKCGKRKIRISAVVHGGTIMAVMSSLTKKDYYDFQVANGEVVSYEF